MEKTFPNKGIKKKINKKRKELDLLYNRWQAKTLKHLIAYSNLKM